MADVAFIQKFSDLAKFTISEDEREFHLKSNIWCLTDIQHLSLNLNLKFTVNVEMKRVMCESSLSFVKKAGQINTIKLP